MATICVCVHRESAWRRWRRRRRARKQARQLARRLLAGPFDAVGFPLGHKVNVHDIKQMEDT